MNGSASSSLTLRAYGRADASATLTVFTEAITRTAAAHYTAEQIEAWARPGRRDLSAWHDAMTARDSVVAVEVDEVVGFSDVDRLGYIDMLFVSPTHLRRGIARSLLQFVEERARSVGTAELSSDVSITARPFFERFGFGVVAEQRVIKEGIEMTNYRMRKVLHPRDITVRQTIPYRVA